MPKSSKRRRNQGARPAQGGAPTAPVSLQRRSLLRWARNGAIAAGLLAAGGWAFVSELQSHTQLHDLSSIGGGVPTVVQIHDRQCPICRQLQKDMLRAAEGFSEDQLLVRVADIGTAEGRALAMRHQVPHVTLLLFDGNGRLRRVLRGPNDHQALGPVFAAHADRGPTVNGAGAPGS